MLVPILIFSLRIFRISGTLYKQVHELIRRSVDTFSDKFLVTILDRNVSDFL